MLTRTIAIRSATLLALALATLPADARQRDPAPYSAKQCISRHGIRDETAETDSRLILHVGGSKAYRNYLPQPCDGLGHVNNVSKVRFKSADPDKLCQGDTVELLDHDGLLGVGGDPTTTRCTLGRFEGINEMSLSEDLRR
ncbi:hypothetical protein HZF05_08985 [Sphingomonas sp. CGMCC 1.13654]|uniref:DUF3617 family protein n=1 Tax=Sphingomonas chungangi TaxID=2683589 RepID=A0A838L4Z3_9SPHN|nr:hypothetical protein [Sphingomonas chungangi]MBA2934234.1 hypothetical protein [Sphingomonas chungangi]MVW57275.1 hypothetical protein [Sphingomonas chungangi]